MSDYEVGCEEKELEINDFRVINVNLPKYILDSYLYDELVNFSNCSCATLRKYNYNKLEKIFQNFNHFLGLSCNDPINNAIAKTRTNKYFYGCMYEKQLLFTTTLSCNLSSITHLIVYNHDTNVNKNNALEIKYLNLKEFQSLEFLQLPYGFKTLGFDFGLTLKYLVLGLMEIVVIINLIKKRELVSSLERISFICYFGDYNANRHLIKELNECIQYYSLNLVVDYFD